MGEQLRREHCIQTENTAHKLSDDSLHSLLVIIPVLPGQIPVAFAVCERRLQGDVMNAARVHGVPTLCMARGVAFKTVGVLTNLVGVSRDERHNTSRFCNDVKRLRIRCSVCTRS